ncbi:MAG TPA: circularly permuted type 2 ATP-grasp protein [Opitutaceae bacterium]|nr:circularly permuted type 2 ATP-grasp protein [Opitutaceae bacterium]
MPAARSTPRVFAPQQRAWRQRLRAAIRDAGFIEPGPRDSSVARSDGPFWELEPTPLVIPAEEWRSLEAGLRQRARFANALLVDLYDRQEVLKQGLLPPDVILGDPYYRRPCLKLEPNRDAPATLLRFDLVKTAEGWHVAQTRANTPVGLSYAVQNRRFMSQEVGELYRQLPDHHSIINFPLQLLEALRRAAPGGMEAPSIVLLTAGPHDPFYTEHSFLARKMGLPLAKGDDLLVLDNRVYFKTIAGLERVDVIYRRLNDTHIDPVVFDTDRETAGVPGLLQCIRAGNVTVANAIGTGIAESRALDAWLPRLMRFYLGEKPLLPALPTYTCGDNDQLDYILDHRDALQIRPAHDPRIGDPGLHRPAPTLLDERGLGKEVRENPFAYVAQQAAAVLPIDPAARRSPPFQLSAFVLADGREFSVLPGGLVHLGANPPPLDRVGVTADALVERGEDAVACDYPPETSEPDEPAPTALRHTLGSRTAETLFWLGRYVERAESTARMLTIIDDVALEEIPARERRRWTPLWQGLLEATGNATRRITTRERPAAALAGDLTWRMTLDAQHASSIYASVESAIYNARKLRDYVSPEAWGVLHRLLGRLEAFRRHGEKVKPRNARAQTAGAIAVVLEDVNAFLATAERTMLHDAGWHFLRVGLHLERSIMTCSALRHVVSSSSTNAAQPAGGAVRDNPELSALLRMLGSQDAYRRLYQTRSRPRHVADFFLRQPAAPRSVFHNLTHIERSLRAIGSPSDDAARVEAAVAALLDRLQHLDPARDFNPAPKAAGTLATFLSTLLQDLGSFHPLLSDHYFSHQARLAGGIPRWEEATA